MEMIVRGRSDARLMVGRAEPVGLARRERGRAGLFGLVRGGTADPPGLLRRGTSDLPSLSMGATSGPVISFHLSC